MDSQAPTPAVATLPSVATFTTQNPRDGLPLAEFAQEDAARVAERVQAARAAATWWKDQGFDGRKATIMAWKGAIARSAAELADVISAETGKPQGDALLEVMLTLSHLDWAAKNAKKELGPRKMHAGLINYNQKATLRYEPYGVVGVIGPWNYPFYTPMGSISYALAAGNAIVFKPSELSPGTARFIEAKWNEVCPQPVFQVATGDRTTGAALVASDVDKIAFTGSTASAKRIMAAAAENLTPMVAECGGNDAMIVVADADLDAAADFIAFGAFGNAGQTCVGVERVYAERSVHQSLVEKVVERAKNLTPGESYGPMTLGTQPAVVAAHIDDALSKGGTAAYGGPESVNGRMVSPVVLTDVPEESAAIQEETFGPTVVINPVDSLDEAVQKANATDFGLGAIVFTSNAATGERLADRLRSGVVTINSVLGFASIPTLPFGGVKGSGFGRIHGADGLREFTTPKSVARQTRKAMLNLLTMHRSDKDMHLVAKMIPMLHGKR